MLILWDWNWKVAMTPYGLLGWNRASKKNKFSGSENLFFRTCLDCFQSTQNQCVVFSPITWWKLSGASAAHILVCAVWLWKIVLSRSPWTMKWNEPFLRGLQGSSQALRKNIFLRPENCLFGTALVKLIDKPGFAIKKSGSDSDKVFFPMPLVKSAKSTSLPRLSSLQIAQMHTIHN